MADVIDGLGGHRYEDWCMFENWPAIRKNCEGEVNVNKKMLRRELLLGGAASLALSGFSAHSRLLAKDRQTADGQTTPDGRIVVIIQLNGGNDGLNTIIPYTHDVYYELRPTLAIPKDRVIKINDTIGLHSAMQGFSRLHEKGKLSIIQGVGYPNPSQSHDLSMQIWQTAEAEDRTQRNFGWIGRAMDDRMVPVGCPAPMIQLGNESMPLALRGRKSTAVALNDPAELLLRYRPESFKVNEPNLGLVGDDLNGQPSLWQFIENVRENALRTSDLVTSQVGKTRKGARYPESALADKLRFVSDLIKAGLGTSVYYVDHAGYDTHAGQALPHYELLTDLSEGIEAFVKDMDDSRLGDRVLVVCFSEFGRRVKENDSRGTDHGAAGPMFLAGANLLDPIVGKHPDLLELEDGNLKFGIDFRTVYASVLHDWLGITMKLQS